MKYIITVWFTDKENPTTYENVKVYNFVLIGLQMMGARDQAPIIVIPTHRIFWMDIVPIKE